MLNRDPSAFLLLGFEFFWGRWFLEERKYRRGRVVEEEGSGDGLA